MIYGKSKSHKDEKIAAESSGSPMKRPVVYIGSFPPPFGGVTVKNSLLFKYLSCRIDMEEIDMHAIRSGSVRMLLKFIARVLRRNTVYVIGLSCTSRERMTSILYWVNRHSLKNSSVFVMGQHLSEESHKMKELSQCRRVYVETDSMLEKLSTYGISNARLFPNCRHFDRDFQREIVSRSLRLVFFSTINEKKGVYIILEALELLAAMDVEIAVDLWGPLDTEDNDAFLHAVKDSNVGRVLCEYKGVFDSVNGDVIELLGSYDCLLLPSLWESEGVPGVLVEAKGASLPAIVSKRFASIGLICDGEDGIVLEDASDAHELASRIMDIESDRSLLFNLQHGAYASRTHYEIDSYLPDIVANLY